MTPRRLVGTSRGGRRGGRSFPSFLVLPAPRLSRGHSLHRPENRTDPLSRTARFTSDPAGWSPRRSPDLRACPEPVERVIHTTYDANGNVASLTPPSRPAHTFDIAVEWSIRQTITASALTQGEARDYGWATSTVLRNNQGEASDVHGCGHINHSADRGQRRAAGPTSPCEAECASASHPATRRPLTPAPISKGLRNGNHPTAPHRPRPHHNGNPSTASTWPRASFTTAAEPQRHIAAGPACRKMGHRGAGRSRGSSSSMAWTSRMWSRADRPSEKSGRCHTRHGPKQYRAAQKSMVSPELPRNCALLSRHARLGSTLFRTSSGICDRHPAPRYESGHRRHHALPGGGRGRGVPGPDGAPCHAGASSGVRLGAHAHPFPTAAPDGGAAACDLHAAAPYRVHRHLHSAAQAAVTQAGVTGAEGARFLGLTTPAVSRSFAGEMGGALAGAGRTRIFRLTRPFRRC